MKKITPVLVAGGMLTIGLGGSAAALPAVPAPTSLEEF